MERELTLDARCPACAAPNLVMRSMTQDLPYFGATLHTAVECPKCDFRHATSMQLEQHPPTRHTLRLRGREDLNARVVRSVSGTYRVPELGFAAEPAEASDSFVTNVEGILERVGDVLVRAGTMFDDRERKERIEDLLRKLQRIRDGAEEATLILEDPYGNSSILSDRAEVEALTEEETAMLRTGVILLDAEDLQPPGGAERGSAFDGS